LTSLFSMSQALAPADFLSLNQQVGNSDGPTECAEVGGDTKPFAASLLQGTTLPGTTATARLLDAGAVAARLGVCRDTVYELCKRGELGHTRVLNAIRIHPDDLAALCARRHR